MPLAFLSVSPPPLISFLLLFSFLVPLCFFTLRRRRRRPSRSSIPAAKEMLSSASSSSSSSSIKGVTLVKTFLKAIGMLRPQGFSRHVLIDPLEYPLTSSVQSFDRRSKTLVVRYVIPKTVVFSTDVKSSSSSSSFHLSTLLSLFDDVSTWSLFPVDPSLRPGVSLTLRASLLSRRLPPPGVALSLVSTVTKCGKNFAFINFWAVDERDGAIVASGQHVKYLAGMGLFYETIMKYCWPAVAFAVDVWTDGTMTKTMTKKSGHDEKKIECVADICKLETVVGAVSSDSDSSSSSSSSSPSSSSASESEATATYLIPSSSLNPLGSLHGGCQAILSHVVAAELYNEAHKNGCGDRGTGGKGNDDGTTTTSSATRTLRHISMTYLSTGKKGTEVDIVARRLEMQEQLGGGDEKEERGSTGTGTGRGGTATVVIKRKNGGEIVSEGILTFD